MAGKLFRLGVLALYYGLATRMPGYRRRPGGELGRRCRRWCCNHLFEFAGTGITVEPGVHIGDGRAVRLGDRSGLGYRVQIYGGAHIGAGVMVGPEVVFLADNHRTADLTRPIGDQGYTEFAPATIEDGAWIGTRAILLPGRRVGEGAVVGAGAVVTRDVAPFTVVGGNPARVLGPRGAETRSSGLWAGASSALSPDTLPE
jgi:maltose O-acetyltransferase